MINQNDKHEFQIPKSKGYLPGHFSSYFALIINWDYHKQYEQPKYPEIQISQIKKYIKKANFFYKDGELENGTNSSALENGRKKMEKRIKATLK